MEHATSGENIAAALKLLEEAATQKKGELRTLMADKFTSLKGLIMEDSGLMKTLAETKKHAVEATLHAKEVGLEKAHELAADVDKRVHENPWPYLGAAAGVGLLLGYILGRGSK